MTTFSAGQIWQTQPVTKLEKIREGSGLFPSLLGKTLSSGELQMEKKGTLGSGDSTATNMEMELFS